VRSAEFSRVRPAFSRVRGLQDILEAESVKYDALNLRNVADPEPEEHRTIYDALNLRNTAPHTAYRGSPPAGRKRRRPMGSIPSSRSRRAGITV